MMMDMQLAYPVPKPPRYPFPEQLRKMEQLKQDNPQSMFGFSAFDPRRDNWRQLADTAIAHGFLGFVLSGAGLPAHRQRRPRAGEPGGGVLRLLHRRRHSGVRALHAHRLPDEGERPERPPQALARAARTRTLARSAALLGHAGGGRASNLGVSSAGWMADNDAEWATPTTSPASSPTCARPTRTCIASWATSPNCWTTRPHASCWSPTSSARAPRPAERPPHDFLDKVAYGSDWHMPSMVDNTARYLDVFVDIMNSPPMPRIATCSSTTRRWRT